MLVKINVFSKKININPKFPVKMHKFNGKKLSCKYIVEG